MKNVKLLAAAILAVGVLSAVIVPKVYAEYPMYCDECYMYCIGVYWDAVDECIDNGGTMQDCEPEGMEAESACTFACQMQCVLRPV